MKKAFTLIELLVVIAILFTARETTLLGSEYFAYHEFEENYRLLKANRDDLSGIVTRRMDVDRIQEAFELFWKGETGKVVIEP